MNDCTIAYKSLGVGTYDYSFELDNEFFNRFDGSEILSGDCQVDVQLKRGESMLEVDVQIDGEVVVACDRCLEDCSIPVEYDGQLIVKFSSDIEEYDGEILWLSPLEGEVDLSQYIYESIVLSLPYQRVHPDGECNPEMIEKFALISNEELAKIASEAEESGESAEGEVEESNRALSASNLAALAALKEKMNE